MVANTLTITRTVLTFGVLAGFGTHESDPRDGCCLLLPASGATFLFSIEKGRGMRKTAENDARRILKMIPVSESMRLYEKLIRNPLVDMNSVSGDSENQIQRKNLREKKIRKNVTFRAPLDVSTSL
jgi:hypothetical protein